jgi:hypothetical protein
MAGQEVAQELELEEACELAERSRRDELAQAIVGEVDADEAGEPRNSLSADGVEDFIVEKVEQHEVAAEVQRAELSSRWESGSSRPRRSSDRSESETTRRASTEQQMPIQRLAHASLVLLLAEQQGRGARRTTTGGVLCVRETSCWGRRCGAHVWGVCYALAGRASLEDSLSPIPALDTSNSQYNMSQSKWRSAFPFFKKSNGGCSAFSLSW